MYSRLLSAALACCRKPGAAATGAATGAAGATTACRSERRTPERGGAAGGSSTAAACAVRSADRRPGRACCSSPSRARPPCSSPGNANSVSLPARSECVARRVRVPETPAMPSSPSCCGRVAPLRAGGRTGATAGAMMRGAVHKRPQSSLLALKNCDRLASTSMHAHVLAPQQRACQCICKMSRGRGCAAGATGRAAT